MFEVFERVSQVLSSLLCGPPDNRANSRTFPGADINSDHDYLGHDDDAAETEAKFAESRPNTQDQP